MNKGPITGVLLLFSSFLGSIFYLFPFMPFIFIAPRIWRRACDFFNGFWLTFPVAIMDMLFATKFSVYGDTIDRKHPSLIIMNHRTRLDWMFLWNALYKMDPLLLLSEKISLKSDLKRIPGAGWAMECNSYVFLERKWEADQQTLSDAIEYYSDIGLPYQILLFPEGTDLCPYNRGRMEAYAKKTGLPVYDHVLHPRTTGIIHILRQMKQQKYLDFVYDVILAYDGPIVQSEVALIKDGAAPIGVQFHVDKYSLDQIPDQDEDVIKWLHGVWDEKEKILTNFYNQQKEEENSSNLLKAVNEVRGTVAKGQVFPDGTHGQNRSTWTRITTVFLWFSCLFWSLGSMYWMYQIWNLLWIKVYFCVAIGTFVYIDRRHGGMERFVIQLNKQEKKGTEKQD